MPAFVSVSVHFDIAVSLWVARDDETAAIFRQRKSSDLPVRQFFIPLILLFFLGGMGFFIG